jgi:hypothetical protein
VPEEQWKQQLLDQIQKLQRQQGDRQPKTWVSLVFHMFSQFHCMCSWFILCPYQWVLLCSVRHGVLMLVLGFKPDLMVTSDDQYLSHHQMHVVLLITVDPSLCRKVVCSWWLNQTSQI